MATIPALGRPAITAPKVLELRPLQDAIMSARQRIEALERALATVAGQAGQTAYAGGGASTASTAGLQTQITALQAEVSTLGDTIDALLALDAGFVTIAAGVLVSRALVAGDNITITNPTGAGGAPVISSTASGGGRGEFILGENDDFLLTESSLHIVLE